MRSLLSLLIGALLVPWAGADEPKTLTLTLRSRAEKDKNQFEIITKQERWQPGQTAVIVCDMWDAHHCLNAVRRVEEMAPRMNQVLEKTRAMGVLIIHAPSSCMEPYKDHPGRKRAQAAPQAKNLPKDIGEWCHKIPAEEKGKYPIDQSDGGEDDDPKEHAEWHAKLKAMGRNPKAPWKSQYAGLKIQDIDAISDSGVEIWNLLEDRKINNVILVGVHTNMCVLGRPFGLRQMSKNGKNVVLIRDMTDTMYNPERAPYVSHFKGTELIIEHIEKYVCPTITSDQVLGGKEFRFKGNIKQEKTFECLEEIIKKTENAITFDPFLKAKPTLLAAIPTREDLQYLLPKHHELLWDHMQKNQGEMEKVFEAMQSGRAKKLGKVLEVKLMLANKEPNLRKALELLPKDVEVVNYVIEYEKASAGGGSWLWVRDHWILFRGLSQLPQFLAELSYKKN